MLKRNNYIVDVLACRSFLSREVEPANLFPSADPMFSPRVYSSLHPLFEVAHIVCFAMPWSLIHNLRRQEKCPVEYMSDREGKTDFCQITRKAQ